MNTAKVYFDTDGNELTIHQMVRRDPHWAASRVQVGEDALELLKEIKRWDIETYFKHGEYSLPQKLRARLQKLL